MEQIKTLFEVIRAKLSASTIKDAVVSKPISAGNRHVLILSEIAMSFGAGGGSGETVGEKPSQPSKGSGGGAGGGAKASPVAILVVENGVVRVESLA